MSLSAPTKPVFLIVLAIVSHFVPIPEVSPQAFWILAAGGGLMTLGCLLRGL